MFAAMETEDDWIDAETWKKGWEVEWASLAKWRRECELKFSPPPKPPSAWSRIGDGLEVAALWLSDCSDCSIAGEGRGGVAADRRSVV